MEKKKNTKKNILLMSVIMWFVKRMLVIILIFVLIKPNLKYYGANFNSKALREAENTFIEYFIEKDTDELFSNFSKNIRDQRANLTKKEIEKAFNFIDGDIISYEVDPIGGEKKQNGFTVTYLKADFFYVVQTDANRSYSIFITYVYLNKADKDYEGIVEILVYDNENRDNEVYVGS